MLTGFPQDWGKERDSTIGGQHKQNIVCIKTQMKGAVILQEAEPDLPASPGGSPVEVCISRCSPRGQGHWQQFWKGPLCISPLGGGHQP